MPVITLSLFLILIFFSIITDLKYQKILNAITFSAAAGGFVANVYLMGFQGFAFSGLGLLVGLSLFFLLFALNLLGAGDVKLMGAIGAILGTELVISTGIYALLIGGIMSLFVLLLKRRLWDTLKKAVWALFTLLSPHFSFELPKVKSCVKTPFALAIAFGRDNSNTFQLFRVLDRSKFDKIVRGAF